MLNKKIVSLVASVIIFVFAVIFTQSLMAQSLPNNTSTIQQTIQRIENTIKPIPQPPVSLLTRMLEPDLTEKIDNLYYAALDCQLIAVKSLGYARTFANKGDISKANDYINKAEKYFKLSDSTLSTSYAVLDNTISAAQATVVYEASMTALDFALMALNPGIVKVSGKAARVVFNLSIEAITLEMDYLMDRSTLSKKDADIKLLAKAITVVILTPAVSKLIGDQWSRGWGSSSAYDLLNNILGSSEIKDMVLKEFMRLGGDIGSYAYQEAIKQGLSFVVTGFLSTEQQANLPKLTSSLGTKASSENAVTVAPTQTTKAVDENPPFTSQGNYWGHMSCMLTKSGTLEDVYSTLGPTYFAASGTRVPSYNSSRVMTVNGISSPPQITALETSTGAVTVGIPVSIDMHELGNNSYMSWGYWLQNSAMQAGGTNYYVNNRGFYLRGDPTTNAQMNDLIAHNVSGTYSGTANGTYWTNTGGANMAGSFNANVNFASRSLNNINMSISGGGHSASISGATATASGSSSTFIGNANGQWKIDGATLGSSSTKDLRGVVLGPTGKAVGGGFGMGQSPATTGLVIGIFQGTR